MVVVTRHRPADNDGTHELPIGVDRAYGEPVALAGLMVAVVFGNVVVGLLERQRDGSQAHRSFAAFIFRPPGAAGTRLAPISKQRLASRPFRAPRPHRPISRKKVSVDEPVQRVGKSNNLGFQFGNRRRLFFFSHIST